MTLDHSIWENVLQVRSEFDEILKRSGRKPRGDVKNT
jgi:hypothetical protein